MMESRTVADIGLVNVKQGLEHQRTRQKKNRL
jgi:hypothetical protein